MPTSPRARPAATEQSTPEHRNNPPRRTHSCVPHRPGHKHDDTKTINDEPSASQDPDGRSLDLTRRPAKIN